MRRGRPLWFLGAVLATWISARAVMLWPPANPIRIITAAPVAAAPRLSPTGSHVQLAHALPITRQLVPVESRATRAGGRSGAEPSAAASVRLASVDATPVEPRSSPPQTTVARAPQSPTGVAVRLQPAAPVAPSRSRLSGDAWLVARPGGGDSLAFGQLGASQAGARLTYALDESRHVALSARVSAPFHGVGREAAVGIDVQPSRLPVHLLVEERVPLDGGAARPAAELFGGVSTPLPMRARLDAYAQGGAVWKRGGFADGAALIVRPLLARGGVRLEAGAGAWGAAQRRVARLDIGPTLAVAVPVGRAALRLGVDYRVRVAGRARPDTGPALTVGTSF